KPFLGAEVRSRDTLTYGRVRARAKLAKGSAVISSLVTIYTPWPADDWNELDIECLGKDPQNIQFNAMVYTGPPTTPPVTTSVSPTQDPLLVDLGFDPSEDFHEYTIEWTPEGAFFFVDGELLRTWTKSIDRMTLPQNVLPTIWASASVGWAGPVKDETAGASAVYDWVELYTYDRCALEERGQSSARYRSKQRAPARSRRSAPSAMRGAQAGSAATSGSRTARFQAME